jgi:drug/metabolite transporter (DMT)-like permease
MLLMLHAMKASNATLAALIEISYPLFIALFSWVFLRESQMNLGTALGAAMILSGIGCIYYFNKTV